MMKNVAGWGQTAVTSIGLSQEIQGGRAPRGTAPSHTNGEKPVVEV